MVRRGRRTPSRALTKARVINAGDGAHEHPTQALLDALTIRQRKGRLDGLKVAIIGDIAHSRVARSNAHLLTKLGSHVWLCSPPTLMPVGSCDLCDEPIAEFLHLTHPMEEAVEDADVIMMLRVQFERMDESFFPSTARIFPLLRSDARARSSWPGRMPSSCIPGP